MKDHRVRENLSPGTKVMVVQKQHQPTGQLTEGVVANLLTNSSYHPRGIKVRLASGIVGRVQQILEDTPVPQPFQAEASVPSKMIIRPINRTTSQ